jgi:hypothetical protein
MVKGWGVIRSASRALRSPSQPGPIPRRDSRSLARQAVPVPLGWGLHGTQVRSDCKPASFQEASAVLGTDLPRTETSGVMRQST